MAAKKKSESVVIPEKKEQQTTENPVKDFFDTLGNKAPILVSGLILLIGFLIFRDYLLFEKAYFFKDIGSDSYNYSFPFLTQEADYISKYGIPKWSFNFGMGQSLFPFFLRDPFDILLYIAGKDHIVYGIVYKELLKIVLGGLVFFYYLRATGASNFSSIIGGILFAYCGFTILGSSWYIFSFESFNMALLLLGYEQLVKNNKWYLFPFAIFLICISQPFNLYVYGVLLIAYTILRNIQLGTATVRNIGGLFLKMAGLGFIGMLISAPLMIENIVQLLESPRGGGTNSYAALLSTTPLTAISDPLQMGTSVMRFFSNDLLGSGSDFKGWTNCIESPLFYCGLSCLVLMPQVFQFLEKKVKISFIIFIGLWLMPIVFPYFRRAFWLFTGDYYRAYAFFVSFFFIYYSVLALDHIMARKKINLVVLIATMVVLFALLNYPFFEDHEIVNPAITVFVCILLLVYAALLFFIGKPGSSVYLKYAFFGVIVFEAIYLNNITVNDRKAVTREDLTGKKQNNDKGYNDYTLDALEYIKQHDNSFYRIDKTYASSPAMHFSINDGMAQGYRGTSGYSPFNQQHYIFYLQLMGISNKDVEIESRWALGLASRPLLESQNRVKYMLAKTNPNPLWAITADSLTTIGDVRIFKNKFVLPVGFTYDHFMRESSFEGLTILQKDFTTLRTCVLKDTDIDKAAGLQEFKLSDTIPPSSFNVAFYKQCVDALKIDTMIVTKFEETSLSGSINCSADKMMYICIPYDGGWTLKVDGQVRDKIILDAGMTGVMLKKGQHIIEMSYDLRYFRTGLWICLIGLLAYAGLWVYLRKRATAN